MTKQDFQRDLESLLIHNTELSPTTAKQKVRKLFKQYEDLINRNASAIQSHKDVVYNYNELNELVDVLKSGVLEYRKGDARCKLLISEVMQTTKGQQTITLTLKCGQSLVLDDTYFFLKDLL